MDDLGKLAAPPLLPAVLSVIAGSADVISFLGLDGLFNAHITGNLVIIASHIVAGQAAHMALLLSVPIFILVLALTSLLAAALERAGVASLQPMLLLQFLLLIGFLILCVADGPHMDVNGTSAIVAGLLGVSAMAVQNALVQISLRGAPPTAVLTTTVTRFTVDAAHVLLNRRAADVTPARRRMKQSWPAIVGFTSGASLGAALFAAARLWSLALPACLALVALAITVSTKLYRAQC
jgi:uncharacterized membrane protein YoaK (UPF0700 family)